ncbi:MAG: NAD(P)-binding protein [Proteobacteria bacterium]|nr:NAD(P)-binding protein [Pseudomonadota bacterium]
MTESISRRDFVNGVLVGAGAGLLTRAAPAATATAAPDYGPSGSAWTGYGGVGDYRWSNGNTEAVRDAAHGIRDHRYPDPDLPVRETYDLLVVGGGFSGTTAAYEFNKLRKPGQSCLVLENHPIFGGEAKQNEFDVDGHRLVAPQGSNGALAVKENDHITGRYEVYAEYYRELGMPAHYDLEPVAGGAEKYTLPNDHFDPMLLERQYPTGYFFKGHGWSANPIATGFTNTPWPAAVRREIDDFANNRRDLVSKQADADRWLDSITYFELLDKLGYGPEVKRYIDPLLGVGNFGVCGNAVSAYAAKRLTLPGTIPSNTPNRFVDVSVVSFPGGNAAIMRKMWARMLPDAISGDGSLAAVATGAVNFGALDREGSPIRLRLQSTAVHVRHDGDPASAGSVLVTYVQGGKLFRVRAKAVVMGSGGWVNRNIVQDLPPAHIEAYKHFRYGPVLTANVAVRHWRFFDKLGFIAARWFSGLGWHVCVRRNVALRPGAPPLTPDSPLVLTFYIPILQPDVDPMAQGMAARAQLLSTSYAEYERQLREQMSEMFGPSGFDARRDIAGIVLNRWGHAYMAPYKGFFFSTDGQPAPPEVIRKPHGRIFFAHSELQGNMNMAHAMLEGRRGARAAVEACKS